MEIKDWLFTVLIISIMCFTVYMAVKVGLTGQVIYIENRIGSGEQLGGLRRYTPIVEALGVEDSPKPKAPR